MQKTNLVGVCKTSHTTHDTKDIVVGGVDTDLGGLGSSDGSSRDNKLKSGVVNSGEVASSRWLVLLGAKGEGVDIDTSVGVSGVVLERLDEVEVGALTLREAVLSVKLELSGDDRVLSPAVHVESGLSEGESASIRYERALSNRVVLILETTGAGETVSGSASSISISIVEESRATDHVREGSFVAEGVEGVG